MEALGLIKFTNTITTKNSVINQYPEVFYGIGKMKGVKVKLHIDKNVDPVVQPYCHIPLPMREKVEKELERLQNADVIEKVYRPTEWILPVVIQPKRGSNDIRLCVDMCLTNKAITRTRHIIPTIEEVRHSLNGAKHFSKIDLKNGYHQLELHPDSRDITTFTTHGGLYRYKRLNFGTTSASEIFHEEVKKKISDINGVFNIHDDILVYGKTKVDHDRALHHLLNRLRDIGITANKKKCIIDSNVIDFFGMRFSEKGMEPDPKKIEALQQAEAPNNVSELKSFLGMTNYSARFIENYAVKTEKLRKLLSSDTKWNWNEEHQQCFEELKTSLQKDNILGCFETNAKTKVIVDASPTGLGAMLIQEQKNGDDKVIAYASRALNEAEQRYSQLERECLAIYFGCIRFQMYLLGKSFVVYTDHKPLVSLLNNPRRNPPFRIERIRLRLQGFNFKIAHISGSLNLSDYTSRHPTPLNPKDESCISKDLSAYVHEVIVSSCKPVSVEEIEANNIENEATKKIIELLNKGQSPRKHDKIPTPFLKIWHELSLENNLILRRDRIVIPSLLQDRIVKVAHEGHLGMVNTKRFLRSKAWFPNMDNLVESEVKHCLPCQATVYKHEREPFVMSELPNGPWEHVKVDFYGPLPSGDYLLEVDEYSRWVEVEIVKSTSAGCTIPKLDKIFATYGIPYRMTTDNGPPFNGKDLKDFANYLDLHHRRITPYWPRANSSAENFNRCLRKTVQAARVEKKNWRQELYRFLRNYRATPHSSTGKSQAALMFPGRSYRTRLPEIRHKCKDDQEIREKDRSAKEKMKSKADDNRNVKIARFCIGDTVLVKQKKLNKLTPPFNPIPRIIVDIKGSMITAKSINFNKWTTRNSSFFKKIPKSLSKNVTLENHNSLDNTEEENNTLLDLE